MSKASLPVLVVLLLLACSAFGVVGAVDYYLDGSVGADGSGLNPGSPWKFFSTAWATLGPLLQTASTAEYTLYVASGTLEQERCRCDSQVFPH